MPYWEVPIECLFDEPYIMRMRYETITCKFCNSPDIVKNGIRQGTQYWLCRNCGRGFVDNKALPRMKYPIEAVGSALYQYFTGSSLNKIREHILQHYDAKPSDSTIYYWVANFSKIACNEAIKTIETQFSSDEKEI